MTACRRLALCLAPLVLSLSAAADEKDKRPEKGPRPDHFQGMTSHWLLELEKELNLSDEQKEQIVSLKKRFEEKHRSTLKKMRQDVEKVSRAMAQAGKVNDPDAMESSRERVKDLRKAAEELRSEFETSLLEILTEEQKNQYEELKKDLSRPGRFRPGKSNK